jgi:hypothetical protein
MIDHKSPLPPAAAKPRWRVTLKRVFYSARGLRTGWKALLFVLIAVRLFLATRPLLSRIAPSLCFATIRCRSRPVCHCSYCI